MEFIKAGSLLLSFSVLGVIAYLLWLKYLKPKPFGMANGITLGRNFLVALIANLIIFDYGSFETLVIFGLAVTVLLMDGLDGYAARRLGISSEFGARFDMESDALFILVLCLGIIVQFDAPLWVLLIGAMRYVYVFAQKAFDPLKLPVKDRYSRKVICVVQVIALTLPFSGMATKDVWLWIVLVSLMLLIFSFGRDIMDQLKEYSGDHHEAI